MNINATHCVIDFFMILKYITTLAFIFIFCFLSTGQQRYDVLCLDSYSKKIIPSPNKSNKQVDSISILKMSSDLINNWRVNGFIFANIDSLKFEGKICSIFIFKGEKYSLNLIRLNNETKNILDIAGVNRAIGLVDSINITSNLKSTLTYLNNHGFPFASVKFDSIAIDDKKVNAKLEINKGQFIKFSPLKYKGRLKVNEKYLQRYLGIIANSPYDHSLILTMQRKIQDIPFVQLDSFLGINFYNQKAELDLYLSAKKANYFDFIIGVQPTTNTTGKRYTINGELNADIYNVLNQGENFRFRFKRLSLEDQELLLSMDYPYVIGLPIGVAGSFSLKRNFSTSVDANAQLGLQYLFTGNNIVKAYWTNTSSRLTVLDTISILNAKKLPSSLDYNYNGIGLSSLYRKLDYRFNPKKGYEINLNAVTGIKTIVQNQSILELRNENVDFTNAYDTLPNAPFQFDITSDISYYKSINKWSSLKINNKTGYKYINGVVLQNEVFRLGGNKSLRGFDELSVFSDIYTMFTVEYRIILDKNSFLSLPFIDYFRGRTINDGKYKTGIGLGLGMNFSTAAGIFNISFAAGNNFNGSPDFGNTKIHFGYVNLF